MFFVESTKGDLERASVEDMAIRTAKVLWATADGSQPTTFLGLVRIMQPRYKENLLCMASIGMKVDAADTGSKRNIDLYRALKGELGKHLRRGVWGVNTKFGGEHYYKDIGISDGAISEYRAGRELAPELGDGFVRFEYRTALSGSA